MCALLFLERAVSGVISNAIVVGGDYMAFGRMLLLGVPFGALLLGWMARSWLVAVVLYDLALLALIVSDGGGELTTKALPVALLANPADAFRVFNLSASAAVAAAGGIGSAANAIPLWQSAASLLVWPAAAILAATAAFRRVTP